MIQSVRHDVVEKHPSDFMLAGSVKDIEEARRQGKIAALIGIEGGHAIEDSLRLLDDFYDLGVRYMTLTHTNTNNWADSSGDITRNDVKHHNGLTPFGKDVVHEMNRIGMIVDVSHVSDKTFWDALEISRAPIFASHSDSRALANAPRNMTDEMIVALAKKGGMVNINFNCGFLSQRYRDEVAAKTSATAARLKQSVAGKNLGELETDQLEGQIIASEGIKPATLADVVTHIDHIRKIAGIDAIGIGTDFNGVECVPQGLEDVSKFPNLTRALLEKGYTAEDIQKIYSGNLLRLMRAVEAAASKMTARIFCGALGVLAIALTGCSSISPAGPRIDPALAGLIPADTVLMVGTRIESIEKTQVYQKYLAHQSLPQIDSFAAETGVDAKKNLWELLYVSNGTRGAVLGHGMFSDEGEPKLQKRGDNRFGYKGFNLVGSDTKAILLLNQTVMAAGDTDQLKAMVDAHEKSAGPPPAMAALLARMPGTAQAWAAYRGGPLQLPFDTSGNLGNVNKIVSLIQSGTVYLDFTAGVKGLAQGTSATDQDAQKLESGLKAIIGFAQISVSPSQPDLQRSAWAGLTVTRENREVKLKLDEPEDLVDKLVSTFMGRLK